MEILGQAMLCLGLISEFGGFVLKVTSGKQQYTTEQTKIIQRIVHIAATKRPVKIIALKLSTLYLPKNGTLLRTENLVLEILLRAPIIKFGGNAPWGMNGKRL
jgi:hypothetical protein